MRTCARLVGVLVAAGFFLGGCVAATKTVETHFREDEILDQSIPPSTEAEYVAVFRDRREPLSPADPEEDAPRLALERLVTRLKKQAFREAADDINRALEQPLNPEKFEYALARADRDFQKHFTGWKLVRQKVVREGGRAEVVATMYFRIDRASLREALVRQGGITPVAKYRTYVELFWNVPKKDISPEVVNTVLENVEDHFAQRGYEIVQFEKIRGDLVQLLKSEGRATDDLFAQEELRRFKANLELRNIDTRFASGKRVLADYADLLIGVTINTVEITPDRMLQVRLSGNATLFEGGEWITLASSDRSAALPHVRGSIDNLVAVAKAAARAVCEDLEPKVRQKLAGRVAVARVRTGTEREFALVFPGFDAAEFTAIKRRLAEGTRWRVTRADLKNRTVHVGYEGRIDTLADLVEMYLSGSGFPVTLPEYAAGGNRIVIGKK
ncbi:hypothetical protein [Deferrisoma sp.]